MVAGTNSADRHSECNTSASASTSTSTYKNWVWAWQVLDLPWLATACHGTGHGQSRGRGNFGNRSWREGAGMARPGGSWPAVATLATALGGDGGRDGGPKAGRDGETTGHASFGGYGPPCGTVLGEL